MSTGGNAGWEEGDEDFDRIDKDDLKRVLQEMREVIEDIVDEVPFPDDSQYPKLNLQAKLNSLRVDIDGL